MTFSSNRFFNMSHLFHLSLPINTYIIYILYIHIYIHIYLYIYTYIHAHTHIHTHIHTHMHAHTHTHAHTLTPCAHGDEMLLEKLRVVIEVLDVCLCADQTPLATH